MNQKPETWEQWSEWSKARHNQNNNNVVVDDDDSVLNQLLSVETLNLLAQASEDIPNAEGRVQIPSITELYMPVVDLPNQQFQFSFIREEMPITIHKNVNNKKNDVDDLEKRKPLESPLCFDLNDFVTPIFLSPEHFIIDSKKQTQTSLQNGNMTNREQLIDIPSNLQRFSAIEWIELLESRRSQALSDLLVDSFLKDVIHKFPNISKQQTIPQELSKLFQTIFKFGSLLTIGTDQFRHKLASLQLQQLNPFLSHLIEQDFVNRYWISKK